MYNSNSLKYYYLYYKESFFLSICIIYLSFLNSEMSLNFSNFDWQDFVNYTESKISTVKTSL